MRPSQTPRLEDNILLPHDAVAKKPETRPLYERLILILSSRLWASDVFSRSRNIALCTSLAGLPFILVSSQGKTAQVMICVATLLVPSILGLALQGTCGVFRALKIQFTATIMLALGGLFVGLGPGAAISAVVLGVIDFAIFAPRSSLEDLRVRLTGFGLLIAVAVIMSSWGATYSASFYGVAIISIVPLMAQIMYGLLALRTEDADKESINTSSDVLDQLVIQNGVEFGLIIDAGGRVTSTGSGAARFLATDTSNLLGRGLFERLHPTDRPALLIACSQLAGVARQNELPLRLRVGEAGLTTLPVAYTLFSARISPIPGNEPATLLILREVVTAVEFEPGYDIGAQAPKSEDEVFKRAKLLSELSHDVRTPLNAILGFAELLSAPMTQPKSPGAIAEYGQIIQRSGRSLLEIVTDLVDLTRLENGVFRMAPEILVPSDVIASSHEYIREKFDSSDLRLVSSGVLHNVEWMVDKRAARQVLATLGIALIEQTHCVSLKIDVSVVNNTLCFLLSCPTDTQISSEMWPFQPIAGLPLSTEVARTLARVMGGSADIMLSDSGKPMAEIQFPLNGAVASGGETALVQLSAFRNANRKKADSSASSLVKKHA